MTVTYQEEPFRDLYKDASEMFKENHAESGVFPDILDLEVYEDFYLWSDEQMNTILVTTARDEDKLVAYSVSFVGNHPHYYGVIFATNDVLYVAPDYRKTEVAKGLIEYTESAAKERGASVMSLHTKCANPCKGLMESVGFVADEIQYFKYIKE